MAGGARWLPRFVPVRRLAGLLAVVGLSFAAAALLLPHSPAQLRELVLSAGWAAPAIALAAWILLTPALFSGTVLAAALRACFGALGGAALSLVGAVLGGLAAFALAAGPPAARSSRWCCAAPGCPGCTSCSRGAASSRWWRRG